MSPFSFTGFCMALCAFALSACQSNVPKSAEIEEAYRNLAQRNLDKALTDFGSEANVPPILLGMIQTTGLIDKVSCKDNPNDLGFICQYNFTPVNSSGVVLDTIPDIKALVWQADVGWMVHEVGDAGF